MAENKKKRRLKLRFRTILIILLLLLFVWWYNNYTLKTVSTSITSADISEPVRITLLSDLHATKTGIRNSTIINKVKKTEPDLIMVLGDMYTRKSSNDLIEIAVDLMKSLVEEGYPVYFVAGDHDTGVKYFSELETAGVHVMNYKSETIQVNNNSLHIMGIDNKYYSPTFDLTNEFSLDENSYNILLAHIPNYEKFAQFGADLTLCADTHGGMIQIPFIGAAYDVFSETFLPTLRTNKTIYDKGWFEYNGGAMFITSGIGANPVPARFNNRPEIVSIDILPEE